MQRQAEQKLVALQQKAGAAWEEISKEHNIDIQKTEWRLAPDGKHIQAVARRLI